MKSKQDKSASATSNPFDSDAVDVALSMSEFAYKTQITKLQEENKLLVAQNVGYSQTVDQLLKQLEDKANHIIHLESMLMNVTPIIGQATPLIQTTEQTIINFQIEKFKSTAMTRFLTLDETRQLDLLIKNKRLLDGNATTIDGKAKSTDGLSREQLIQIASRPIKTE